MVTLSEAEKALKSVFLGLINDALSGPYKVEPINPKKLIGKQTSAVRIKIGRNDKCPCGSGYKYKNCCMEAK